MLEGGSGFPGMLKILDETFEEASAGYREWLMDYMSPSHLPRLPSARACSRAAWRSA